MHLLASLSLIASAATPTRAASATVTSRDMYTWYCKDHAESLGCQHHDLIQQMIKEKDKDAKKAISAKIATLNKGNTTPLHKKISGEYASMKEAFCATNPPGSKSLCAAPSSQFRTASTKTARPTTSLAGSPSSGHSDVMTWYCSKPGKVDEPVCARHKVTTQLRTPGLKVEERKQLADQLRLNPVAYATTQAIYADYCKLPGNAEKPTCTRLKTTAAAKAMREWYCTQPGKADSSEWCKRAALLEKLQKIPATTTDAAKAADRKQLTAEYAAFSKRPEGGGPSRATAASEHRRPPPHRSRPLPVCVPTPLTCIVPVRARPRAQTRSCSRPRRSTARSMPTRRSPTARSARRRPSPSAPRLRRPAPRSGASWRSRTPASDEQALAP